MAIQNKDIRKRKIKKSPALLTQSEIIKKLNASTRKSRRYLELLAWKYGK